MCIRQHSKSKNIILSNKAWNKIKTLEATVSNYAEAGKEGRWFLDQDWYIHTNIFTFSNKKTAPKKYPSKQKGQQQQQNKEADNKDDGGGDDHDDSETVCLIHIRRWYLFNNKHRPGKGGLTFNLKSWQGLKEYMAPNKQEQGKTGNTARAAAAAAAAEGHGDYKETGKRKAEGDNEDQAVKAIDNTQDMTPEEEEAYIEAKDSKGGNRSNKKSKKDVNMDNIIYLC